MQIKKLLERLIYTYTLYNILNNYAAIYPLYTLLKTMPQSTYSPTVTHTLTNTA